MTDLTLNIIAYFGCFLCAFLIGFLELLRFKILSWLPFAGTSFFFASRSESHAELNSLFLYILLIGLVIMTGASSLFTDDVGAIHWHWSKGPLILISILSGEYLREKLYAYMTETDPLKPRSTLTETQFRESVETKRRADFLSSDYARQFATFEDYQRSLKE